MVYIQFEIGTQKPEERLIDAKLACMPDNKNISMVYAITDNLASYYTKNLFHHHFTVKET